MITNLTKHILLHHLPGELPKTVVISSHGKYEKDTSPLRVPGNTTLVFTCRHGDTSTMRLLNVMTGFVHDAETLNTGEEKPDCRNYILSKCQDDQKREGVVSETFKDIDEMLRINRTAFRKQVNNIVQSAAELSRLQGLEGFRKLSGEEQGIKRGLEKEHVAGRMAPTANMAEAMDVITVEDATNNSPITVLDVINAVQEKYPTYTNFIGGFCRVLWTPRSRKPFQAGHEAEVPAN